MPIAMSTIRALRHSGGLNAGTPFDTASVLASATEPAENAADRNTRALVPVRLPTPGGWYSGSAPSKRKRP